MYPALGIQGVSCPQRTCILRAAGLTYSHLLFPYHQPSSFKLTEKQRFSSQAMRQKPPVAPRLHQVSAAVLVFPQKALTGPWVTRLLQFRITCRAPPWDILISQVRARARHLSHNVCFQLHLPSESAVCSSLCVFMYGGGGRMADLRYLCQGPKDGLPNSSLALIEI